MSQALYLKKGSTVVYIEASEVDESFGNTLTKVPKPVTKSNQGTRQPGTLIVDLKRIEHLFIITGFLSASAESGNKGSAWSGGTMSTAKDVKNALIKDILFSSGDIELHYRNYVDSDYGATYNDGTISSSDHIKVALDKFTIKDQILRSDVSAGGTDRFSITISLTRGKIK
jgi:hypothetical protein